MTSQWRKRINEWQDMIKFGAMFAALFVVFAVIALWKFAAAWALVVGVWR